MVRLVTLVTGHGLPIAGLHAAFQASELLCIMHLDNIAFSVCLSPEEVGHRGCPCKRLGVGIGPGLLVLLGFTELSTFIAP